MLMSSWWPPVASRGRHVLVRQCSLRGGLGEERTLTHSADPAAQERPAGGAEGKGSGQCWRAAPGRVARWECPAGAAAGQQGPGGSEDRLAGPGALRACAAGSARVLLPQSVGRPAATGAWTAPPFGFCLSCRQVPERDQEGTGPEASSPQDIDPCTARCTGC